MKFTVELTADQVAMLDRLQLAGIPAASIEDKARHLLEAAIADEQNIQAMMDNPPPSLYEPHPF